MADAPLSTGQLARQFGVPSYAVRRALDAIAPDAPRVGQNRAVDSTTAKRLAQELYQRGYLARQPKAD